MGLEWYIEQLFRELPFWMAVAIAIFLGILLMIWLLLPLWILFIKWDTGRIKGEIQTLVDLIEKKGWNEKKKSYSGQKE